MDRKLPVAVVTGGAVRIGRALCLDLARQGMRICLHYAGSSGAAQQTLDEIRSIGVDAVAVQADFCDPARAAETIMTAAQEAFGQVDVLINSAAIFEPSTLADLTEDVWHRHQSINLAAPLFLCQRFAAAFDQTAGRTGAIVNIADWRAQRPQSGHLAYTISKAGLVTMTQILAQELAPAIRVNAISPGAILPPAGAGPGFEQQISEVIPLHRTGTPDDIVAAVRFLLSSEFVTGEVLQVTGGQQLTVQKPGRD